VTCAATASCWCGSKLGEISIGVLSGGYMPRLSNGGLAGMEVLDGLGWRGLSTRRMRLLLR
jgi:hypothetical protein